MKSKISAVIAVLLFFFLSKGCISDYMKGSDKSAIANYEKMISDGSRTMATLDNRYKEVTVKILGIPSKTYEFTYHFDVQGSTFSGRHDFSELPTSNSIQVYYLATNPSINSTDPRGQLAAEKEKSTSKSSLYWGIGWGLLCFFSLVGFISEFKKKKPEAQPVQ